VVIEQRDPAEIKACRGTPTTIPEIDAYYPAFDITPPHLVAGVITVHGILSPYDLHRHYT
jgi:methylthioribose-1-phosphate isomerase